MGTNNNHWERTIITFEIVFAFIFFLVQSICSAVECVIDDDGSRFLTGFKLSILCYLTFSLVPGGIILYGKKFIRSVYDILIGIIFIRLLVGVIVTISGVILSYKFEKEFYKESDIVETFGYGYGIGIIFQSILCGAIFYQIDT